MKVLDADDLRWIAGGYDSMSSSTTNSSYTPTAEEYQLANYLENLPDIDPNAGMNTPLPSLDGDTTTVIIHGQTDAASGSVGWDVTIPYDPTTDSFHSETVQLISDQTDMMQEAQKELQTIITAAKDLASHGAYSREQAYAANGIDAQFSSFDHVGKGTWEDSQGRFWLDTDGNGKIDAMYDPKSGMVDTDGNGTADTYETDLPFDITIDQSYGHTI